MTAEPAMSAEPGVTAEPAMSAGPSRPASTPNAAAESLQMHPWATATLTDVSTGETFTIAQLAGKPIFIETMAIWCSNCRAQQARFTEAFGKMAPGTASYVVLTVEAAETAEDLARYKAERGFTGRYAVAGKDVTKALEAEFGPNAINPPSVPLVFVSATGEVSFGTGSESVEDILEAAGV
jgi:thiol-disulfide isomerase/thioredoxin